MRPFVLVCAVCLISVPAFAQRGGHGGGGSHGGGGVSHAGGGFSRGGVAGRPGGYRPGVYGYRNFSYGRSWWPYYGLGWASYGWGPYYGGDYYTPYYDSSSSYGYPYDAGAYEQQPPVIVNQAIPYAEPAPPPEPVVREYTEPRSQATDNSPVLYLFALKNNSILAALTYWTEKGELHYVNLDHQMKAVPLSSIDRELTDRLNRERNLAVRLPG